MKSYKKILIFFKKFNVHRSFQKKFVQKKNPIKIIYSYSNNKFTLNLNYTIVSLYTTLKLISFINKNKNGSILIIGNFENLPFSDLFKKVHFKNIIFIHKWLPGIISNWEGFSNIIKNQKTALSIVKKSQKLRFFRFFYTFFNFKKPKIVIVFQNNNANIIIKECFDINIPVIFLSSTFLCSRIISYQVPSNINNFFSSLLFSQIFISQITFHKKNYGKNKNI